MGLGPQFSMTLPPLTLFGLYFGLKLYFEQYVMEQSNDILCDDCDSIPEVNGLLLIVKCKGQKWVRDPVQFILIYL